MADGPTQALLDFVRLNFQTEATGTIDLDTPLVTRQIVDSMGVTLLAAFIEEHFDVPFDGTELRKGRLETVRGIAAWLARRR